MREETVERYLIRQVEVRGGLCEKHVSPGRRGVPDRLITWPQMPMYQGGHMELVETKAPKKGPSAAQQRDHARRVKRGVRVWVLSTKEQVDTYIRIKCG